MMIVYLLKSAICLMVLLLIHRLLLQRESMHQFNRFFLLMAVVGSFLIPLITIEVAPEAVVQLAELREIENPSSDFSQTYSPVEVSEFVATAEIDEKPFDWQKLLWITYGLISVVFLIRFIRNIHLLLDKINRNIHVRYRGETLVLLKEQSLPFSFLSYIFVTKEFFKSQQFTDAIFAHEQAHVHGKHSWDILFIEALLIPLWFHPGLYYASQAIKLNHEFIADQAALGTTPVDNYKTLLLSMLLPDQKFGLASSLNFSLTKKRFEMLKRKTTNPTKWIKILFVLPVLAAMVYIFSEKVIAQAEEEKLEVAMGNKELTLEEKKEIIILFRTDGKLEVDGQIIEVGQLAELIDSEINKNLIVRISAYPDVKMGFVADVHGILREKNVRGVIYHSKTNKEKASISVNEKEETNILIRADGKIEVDGKIMEVSQLAELIDSKNIENTLARISADSEVEMGFLADVKEILGDKNIRRVVYQSLHDQEIGSILHPVPTDLDDRQTTLAAFKELNGVYQVKLNQKGPFAKKSDREIKQLLDMFTSLQEKYTGLSYEDKRIIQRPSFPYARLEKDGKMIFKRFEDLTEEERKTLSC